MLPFRVLLLATTGLALMAMGEYLHSQTPAFVSVRHSASLMGSRFDITLVTENEDVGYVNIDEAIAEISRVEKMISSWDPGSETSLINENAGISPVKVSREFFKLIQRAVQISEITNGAFDITYSPLTDLWRQESEHGRLPSPEQISNCLDKVGYQRIELDPVEQTVFLTTKGMRLSFGGIGKGYAVDRAKELLTKKQVEGGLINAGGDITAWGRKPNGDKWLLGIEKPRGMGILDWLPLVESSAAVTANFQQYVTINEKRYSHIINPKTGYPVRGINKVTVLSKTAELSDALATAVVILGTDNGLSLINQLGGTEAVILDNLERVHHSQGILLKAE